MDKYTPVLVTDRKNEPARWQGITLKCYPNTSEFISRFLGVVRDPEGLCAKK